MPPRWARAMDSIIFINREQLYQQQTPYARVIIGRQIHAPPTDVIDERPERLAINGVERTTQEEEEPTYTELLPMVIE